MAYLWQERLATVMEKGHVPDKYFLRQKCKICSKKGHMDKDHTQELRT